MIVTFVMQLVDAQVARASYQGCAALANAYFAKQLIGDDLISSILGYGVTG